MIKTVVFSVFGLLAAVVAVDFGFQLLNKPSDMAVIAGVGILVAVSCAILVVGRSLVKKYILPILMIVLGLGCQNCNKIIKPGHVGILVQQTGSDRGVQDYPIQTGRVFYNPWNEDVLEWPTNVQRVIWSKTPNEGKGPDEELTFQSKEGLRFTADVNAAYQLQREKIPHFYVQFRTEDMDGFTHGFFRDSVRNALSISTQYSAEEINGDKQAELIQKVQEAVQKRLAAYGVDVIQVGFAAPPTPPEQVSAAIHSKIASIQKSEQTEFEKRAAIAEGEKIKALADAMAEANKVTNASLTPQLIEWEKVKKWNGQNPQVVGGGSGISLIVGK